MSSEIKTTGIDPQVQADEEAVLRHAFDGAPLDPDIARRVDERADRITEEIRRVHGIIDDNAFNDLINDDDAT